MAIQVRPTIPLRSNGTTCLGSAPSCEAPLKHPLIADRHAEIIRGPGKTLLRDLGTGTVVNGQRVLGGQVDLNPEDRIEIGPFVFRFTGLALEAAASLDRIELTALGLSRSVFVGKRPRPILQDVSLVIQPGQFVCLLGPSGCGKSTLMAALSGRIRPDSGQVRINDRDLYTHFETLKPHMVLVPQKPLLHRDLTVEEALRSTALLRLPRSADRAKRVEHLLEAMKLVPYRKSLIRDLSGGQEKRVSLANELISGPGLIFLDEVTSGLDENIDGEMMNLFRDLAREGKTVVCVTHSLVHVPETCDLVVFLAPGGRLAYVGPPGPALTYFNVPRLGEAYDLLRVENADRCAARFAGSSEHATFVASLMPANQSVPPASPPRRAKVRLPTEAITIAHQTIQLAWRQLLLLRRDLAALGSLLGQVLLVALILGLAFGKIDTFPERPQEEKDDEAQLRRLADSQVKRIMKNQVFKSSITRMDYVRKLMNLGFLLAVTSFWFGCNNAAKEIVRERSITTQERLFNLRSLGYYLSKLLILTTISWLQVTLLLALVCYACAPPVKVAEYLPLLLALALAGTTLGLLLSAVATSEQVAVTLIPIAIIPQIVLSGAIVKLSGTADWLGWLGITTYWGKRGMDALLLGEAGDFARRDDVNLIEATGTSGPMWAILFHAAVFAGLTLAALSANWTLSALGDKIKRSWRRLVGR